METSYTLFLDRYGYVRLATEANKGLALLTDAYYGTDWRNGDYRVETWAMGAEEATDVTVTADKGLSHRTASTRRPSPRRQPRWCGRGRCRCRHCSSRCNGR